MTRKMTDSTYGVRIYTALDGLLPVHYMTADELDKAVEQGTVIMPLTAKEEEEGKAKGKAYAYLNAGFTVAFLRTPDFREYRKHCYAQ